MSNLKDHKADAIVRSLGRGHVILSGPVVYDPDVRMMVMNWHIGTYIEDYDVVSHSVGVSWYNVIMRERRS